MKKILLNTWLFALLTIGLSSCEAIGSIFKAGVWSGVTLIIVAIVIIILVLTRLTKRK
ncbi:MAG: phosphatidate cytidylyltransferase [Chitinophagaceae bacterium]